MQSQYTNEYLEGNRKRGYGKGITPATFLSYQLRGRARSWSGRYLGALVRSCYRAGAESGLSTGGSKAWYPVGAATPSIEQQYESSPELNAMYRECLSDARDIREANERLQREQRY